MWQPEAEARRLQQQKTSMDCEFLAAWREHLTTTPYASPVSKTALHIAKKALHTPISALAACEVLVTLVDRVFESSTERVVMEDLVERGVMDLLTHLVYARVDSPMSPEGLAFVPGVMVALGHFARRGFRPDGLVTTTIELLRLGVHGAADIYGFLSILIETGDPYVVDLLLFKRFEVHVSERLVVANATPHDDEEDFRSLAALFDLLLKLLTSSRSLHVFVQSGLTEVLLKRLRVERRRIDIDLKMDQALSILCRVRKEQCYVVLRHLLDLEGVFERLPATSVMLRDYVVAKCNEWMDPTEWRRCIAALGLDMDAVVSSTHARDDPQEFVCPITHSLMRDPVVASDGHTYEREALQTWCDRRGYTSPLTRAPLEACFLPNRNLQTSILRYQQEHKRDVSLE